MYFVFKDNFINSRNAKNMFTNLNQVIGQFLLSLSYCKNISQILSIYFTDIGKNGMGKSNSFFAL